ncbi:MAG TPA: hypothetical protein PK987_01785 [Ferruginibacter sp.]|nr:hypothetical protein [Ferruginibacter sp.]
MNKIVSKLLLIISCLFCSFILFAQDTQPDMADTMRSNGKIYVVVAVCLTILIGLFIYVFLLDKKISRMEKEKE